MLYYVTSTSWWFHSNLRLVKPNVSTCIRSYEQKSRDAVPTFISTNNVSNMGSQSVHSILWHNWQNRPEDDYSIVETYSLIITLSNKVIVLTYTIWYCILVETVELRVLVSGHKSSHLSKRIKFGSRDVGYLWSNFGTKVSTDFILAHSALCYLTTMETDLLYRVSDTWVNGSEPDYLFWRSEETVEKSLPTWKWCHETLKCVLIFYSTKNVGNQKCTENPSKEPEVKITVTSFWRIFHWTFKYGSHLTRCKYPRIRSRGWPL